MAYQQYRQNSFRSLPTVVKNLLIINVFLYVTTLIVEKQGINLTDMLGLHYPTSPQFRPYQLVTHMFMHAAWEGGQINFTHILFNMFALWMFGPPLENFWGPKRFLIFYMVAGLGAAALQIFVTYLRVHYLYSQVPADELNTLITQGTQLLESSRNFVDPTLGDTNLQIYMLTNNVTIGASGAIFGVLAAFGMLFPNTELYLMFIPIPVKAKYAVVLYGAVELFLGVANFAGDNVAHFAHVGGALFGFILVRFWHRGKHF